MKRFLFRTAIFALLVMCFCIGFELLLLFIPNDYSVKRDYLEGHKDEINILVLGHSHFHNGLDSRVLSHNAYNASEGGRLTYYDAQIAKKHISRMPNLKMVIWPLGYNFQYMSYLHGLDGKEPVLGDSYKTFQCMYAKYFGWAHGKPMWIIWSELLNSDFKYTARLDLAESKKIRERNDSLKGWLPLKSGTAEEVETVHLPIPVDYNTEYAHIIFDENLEYVDAISQLCRERGIRFVIVSTPVYKSYQKELTERGEQELARFVDALKVKNPDIVYLNYLRDNNYEMADFFNASHLSECGAAKFSKRLADDLLSQTGANPQAEQTDSLNRAQSE